MSKLELSIKAPPFSINSAYYLKSFNNKKATKIRTQACRDWGDSILIQLQKYKDKLIEMNKNFDEKCHAIKISLDFYIPEKKLYTKSGNVSALSSDITNIEKLLVDLIFDARFHGRALGGGLVTNLNINDKFIVEMRSRKMPCNDEYLINISIEIVDNRKYF